VSPGAGVFSDVVRFTSTTTGQTLSVRIHFTPPGATTHRRAVLPVAAAIAAVLLSLVVLWCVLPCRVPPRERQRRPGGGKVLCYGIIECDQVMLFHSTPIPCDASRSSLFLVAKLHALCA
jgi:hypothetical protein